MKNYLSLLFILLLYKSGFAQSQQLWKGYYSYNQITDLSLASNKVYAACQNAYFDLNVASGEVKTYNTIDGLSGQNISAIYHSPTFKKTIIGYENGLLIIKNDATGTIMNLVDIINKSIPQNIKRINHFMEFEGIIYISCDFGIVQYNLSNLVFGDTYLIGNNGTQIVVKQTAVFEGKIYAATSGFGIRTASLSNPNLIDYNQWTALDTSSWFGIEAFQNQLIALDGSSGIYKIQNSTITFQSSLAVAPLDFRANGDYLISTNANSTVLYNTNLSQVLTVNASQIPFDNTKFTSATVADNFLYIGTNENGLFKTEISTGTAFENILPDGPISNSIFSVTNSSKKLWAVYGGHDERYSPFYKNSPFDSYTVENGWTTIPRTQTSNALDLCRVTVNPNNTSQYFVSSYFSGLLKYDNDVLTTHYTTINSGLQSIFNTNDNIRIEQSVFDSTGNLWMTNGFIDNAIKVLKTNGQWQSYNLQSVTNSKRFGRIAIDKNNTKWITSRQDGLIGFNETNGAKFIKIQDGSNGNLPVNTTQAVAVDTRNQLWIGTTSGLRVLSNVDSFLSSTSLTTDAIIILEEDLAQELLYEQNITDIVVDGANNKWIGTLDAGVFQVSPDGQKTLQHFTTSSSPLPSNFIIDVEIDAITGEVYLVTNKGMISYKGTATSANDNLNNVYLYPNPVRPEHTGTVKISGLLDKATVKITDINGNLVHEETSEGGTIEWDTTAFGKYRVSSGVYMVLISAKDGVETKVKKLMIVR